MEETSGVTSHFCDIRPLLFLQIDKTKTTCPFLLICWRNTNHHELAKTIPLCYTGEDRTRPARVPPEVSWHTAHLLFGTLRQEGKEGAVQKAGYFQEEKQTAPFVLLPHHLWFSWQVLCSWTLQGACFTICFCHLLRQELLRCSPACLPVNAVGGVQAFGPPAVYLKRLRQGWTRGNLDQGALALITVFISMMVSSVLTWTTGTVFDLEMFCFSEEAKVKALYLRKRGFGTRSSRHKWNTTLENENQVFHCEDSQALE